MQRQLGFADGREQEQKMRAEESPASDGSIDETKEYIAAEVAKLEKESKRLKKELTACLLTRAAML